MQIISKKACSTFLVYTQPVTPEFTLQERETASGEADSVAKLRLMRQDAAAKGAQLETLLSSARARLEAMLGRRSRGEPCLPAPGPCKKLE